MNKEELKENIQNICFENPKAIKYSIVLKLVDFAEQYATSQTSALKKEVEELKEKIDELFLYVITRSNNELKVLNGFRVSDILKELKRLTPPKQ